jgi:spore coat protein U domain-containing protein, fimbrial subunit CupE1/2/3/6
MRTTIVSYLAGALLASAAVSTLAQSSTTGNLSVTSSVAQSCTLTTISTLAFGGYDPVGANASTALPGTGSVSVNCTKGSTGITIDLDGGANLTGSQRRMKGATVTTEFLNYSITQPATGTPWTSCAGSTVWGSTVGGSVYTPTVTWDGTTVNAFTVCGSVPAAQNVSAQSYSDTVLVTVNF